ncbi:MAG: plasmid pRiA4b ORF-3 family protein [Verrucomicrobia bacterium]|nr:plasmid pRiA4b ORF-3 family protein [Verrucomicrobiota bacterium]
MDHPRPRARLTTRPRQPASPIKWYQLKITLECTKPAVWRRIAVRGDIKLDLLHAVLQLAMGWTNSHLHMFLIGADRYSDSSMIDNPGWGGDEDKDERKLTLAQVVDRGFNLFGYEYDFGDSWTHLLAVEKELPPDPASKAIARCLDGARACPPEDCGGFPGFEELLKVMKNPKHREYRSMVEWLGAPFDPEAFNLRETNLFLARLKWPRTSVEQLARILQARFSRRSSHGAA